MERIHEALEKARRQRDGLRAAAHARPAAAAGVGGGAAKTRIVPTDGQALRERRVVAPLTHEGLADTFRILRTQVVQKLAACGASTLAITSPSAGEGKTLTAVNLAISLAAYADRFVLLVDLDLRRPGVHKLFEIAPDVGLTDYLDRDVPLADCLVSPGGIERLVLLPAGAPLLTSSETLSSPKMAGLVGELKNRYADRIVLYDLPPLLVTDDALVFLRLVDACLVVFEEGGTKRADIERALELLRDVNVIGTVLNKARQTTTRHYTP